MSSFTRKLLLGFAALSISAGAAFAESSVKVGGAPMYPSKNIVENASIRRITQRWLPPSRPPGLSTR